MYRAPRQKMKPQDESMLIEQILKGLQFVTDPSQIMLPSYSEEEKVMSLYVREGYWSQQECLIGDILLKLSGEQNEVNVSSKAKHFIASYLPTRTYTQIDTHLKKENRKKYDDQQAQIQLKNTIAQIEQDGATTRELRGRTITLEQSKIIEQSSKRRSGRQGDNNANMGDNGNALEMGVGRGWQDPFINDKVKQVPLPECPPGDLIDLVLKNQPEWDDYK